VEESLAATRAGPSLRMGEGRHAQDLILSYLYVTLRCFSHGCPSDNKKLEIYNKNR
jgi:hypothetical protein